jgi:hypothetical protein
VRINANETEAIESIIDSHIMIEKEPSCLCMALISSKPFHRPPGIKINQFT